jgi:hypothetical protein
MVNTNGKIHTLFKWDPHIIWWDPAILFGETHGSGSHILLFLKKYQQLNNVYYIHL